jgi:hypothetical protein
MDGAIVLPEFANVGAPKGPRNIFSVKSFKAFS